MKILSLLLTYREHAVIMAALRHSQDSPTELSEHLSYSDEKPTSADEIDSLAEKVSCEASEVN